MFSKLCWLILLYYMFTNHIEDADSQVDNKDLKNIRKNIQFCKKNCLIYFLSLEQSKKNTKSCSFWTGEISLLVKSTSCVRLTTPCNYTELWLLMPSSGLCRNILCGLYTQTCIHIHKYVFLKNLSKLRVKIYHHQYQKILMMLSVLVN